MKSLAMGTNHFVIVENYNLIVFMARSFNNPTRETRRDKVVEKKIITRRFKT